MSPKKQIYVANAPVSYGAFEVTVGFDENVPDGLELLDAVAAAKYDGIDLGPIGYLGTKEELGQRLFDRGLGLAGGYIEFSYHQPSLVDKVLPELDAMLDIFDSVADFTKGKPAPRPTIADAGSDARRATPGAGASRPEIRHSEEQWELFQVGLSRVVSRCRERGYEPTLHCETGSFLESTWEIEKALQLCDVDVCLETGHQMLGGANIYEFLKKWSGRINHVHLKDVTMRLFNELVANGEKTSAIWDREVFPRLGEGDLDVAKFIHELNESGFEGWLVVEQDIFPKTPQRFAKAIEDQKYNREFLSTLGL